MTSGLDNYVGEKGSIEERFVTRGVVQLARDHAAGRDVLNLGVGNGLLMREVDALCGSQHVIEGDAAILDRFRFDSPRTTFHHGLFEDIDLAARYDVALANHVLEHIGPVRAVLERVRQVLRPGGRLVVSVPNALSLHRRIGVQMGLLGSVHDLNETDLRLGHVRVYDPATLAADLEASGFRIVESGGFNVKLVSLMQMKDWPQETLDAIFEVSKTLPQEICSNLWAVAEPAGS